MGLFDNFPYTNFHELNLDWILKVLKDIETTIDQFVSLNIIKYADPIQWDITRQYPKNTIVIDPISGTAYISVDNVPQGVPLSNTDYWSVVFDLGRFITLASSNFADSYESVLTTTATMPTDEGHWVVWNSILYEALNDIHVGDRYVEDGNIKRRTVEYFCRKITDQLAQEILDRIAADNALDGRIDQEILDRIAADNALDGRIDQEILDRQAADNMLSDRIAAVASSTMKTIFDYGYQTGSNITQYIQAFINDDSASELYLHMNGDFEIDTLDFTALSGAIDRIKHFTKSANTRITGDGAIQLSIATSAGESSEIRAMYSTGSDGYPHRFVRTSDTIHTPNGNTQINAMFIDNVLNRQDGFYHWNILGQSNIYSETTGEDCVAYLQAHVYGDNENWALATENILHLNNEAHNTRGIEVALTGAGDVSPNGGKRIGIHIVTNTTGGGFNADYGIFFSSHANNTGFKRLIEISNGYSEYVLKAEPNYTCVYGIDFSTCNVNGAAIRLGQNGGHCIQYNEFVTVEENQLGVQVLAIKHGANNLGITMNTSTNVSGIVKYLDVIYNGETFKIPMYQ